MKKIHVIANHDGPGTLGSRGSHYDEGSLIARALLDHGHVPLVHAPAAGLNGVIPDRSTVILTTQPHGNNAAIGDFLRFHPWSTLLWRPGWSQCQLDLYQDILRSGNIPVVQLSFEKARQLLGLKPKADVADAALELNELKTDTLVVVTDRHLAAAARFDRVVVVPGKAWENTVQFDGYGPGFFAAFSSKLLCGATVTSSLHEGHRFAAKVASGEWLVPGSATND